MARWHCSSTFQRGIASSAHPPSRGGAESSMRLQISPHFERFVNYDVHCQRLAFFRVSMKKLFGKRRVEPNESNAPNGSKSKVCYFTSRRLIWNQYLQTSSFRANHSSSRGMDPYRSFNSQEIYGLFPLVGDMTATYDVE